MKNLIAVVAVVFAASTVAQPATAGGGIIGLTAHGAQDVYLTGEPQTTFKRHTYKHHGAQNVYDTAAPHRSQKHPARHPGGS